MRGIILLLLTVVLCPYVSYSQREIIVQDGETDNIRPNCGEAEGMVDATVTGGWRYLVFDDPDDYVDIPAQYITEQN